MHARVVANVECVCMYDGIYFGARQIDIPVDTPFRTGFDVFFMFSCHIHLTDGIGCHFCRINSAGRNEKSVHGRRGHFVADTDIAACSAIHTPGNKQPAGFYNPVRQFDTGCCRNRFRERHHLSFFENTSGNGIKLAYFIRVAVIGGCDDRVFKCEPARAGLTG